MKDLRQISLGILAALISAGLVLGSFSLALTEGAERVALLATPTSGNVQAPVASPELYLPTTASPTQGTELAASETVTLTITPTPTASPIICQKPEGWTTITLEKQMTLENLARIYNVSESDLIQENCLDGLPIHNFEANMTLYVPGATPSPTPTSTPVSNCVPPAGWVRYTIQSGDNLFRLSRELGVTVAQLQFANCLGSSILIRAGDILYVPFIPVRPTATRPPFTSTPTLTFTPITPTLTFTPVTPTLTFTPITPTLTFTPITPTLTFTPITPTLTFTPITPTLTFTPVTPISNTPTPVTPTPVTPTPVTPTPVTPTPETPTIEPPPEESPPP